MGINGLRKFLRDSNPELFIQLPSWKSFSGQRLAVDASVYLYKFISVSNRTNGNWIDLFINFITKFLKNNIRTVFIFDGKAPIEKENTQKNRRSGRSKIKQKMVVLDTLIDQINDCEIGEPLPMDILERITMVKIGANFSRKEILRELNDEYKKESSRFINIGPAENIKLQELLTFLGMPWYIAAGEAERSCSWLCKWGYVKGVLSADSDVLAYGAPLFITEVKRNEEKIIEMIRYKDVLHVLDLTTEQFKDFCIMCGTDYNDRMRGIGAISAYKMMCEHGNLDEIAGTSVDTDILTYKNVRRLFSLPDKNDPSAVFEGATGTTFRIAPVRKMDKGRLIMYLFKNNSRFSVEELEYETYSPRFIIGD